VVSFLEKASQDYFQTRFLFVFLSNKSGPLCRFIGPLPVLLVAYMCAHRHSAFGPSPNTVFSESSYRPLWQGGGLLIPRVFSTSLRKAVEQVAFVRPYEGSHFVPGL